MPVCPCLQDVQTDVLTPFNGKDGEPLSLADPYTVEGRQEVDDTRSSQRIVATVTSAPPVDLEEAYDYMVYDCNAVLYFSRAM